LEKGTCWKVTKETINIENEEFFNCARSRLKSLNPPLCIRKINIMHLLKRRKIEQREIKECVESSILVIGDVRPTQNLQELS
jgi:hypothetical protein